MKISDQLTNEVILAALGARAERQRIEAGLTQADLAREAGLSKRTVERIEGGKGCELVMLIRVLRVLQLTDGFNALLPELPPSPMALLKLKGKERRRVAHTRRVSPSPPVPGPTATGARAEVSQPPARKAWTWGK